MTEHKSFALSMHIRAEDTAEYKALYVPAVDLMALWESCEASARCGLCLAPSCPPFLPPPPLSLSGVLCG